MTGMLFALLGILGALGMTILSDMVSEEARDRLDHLPHAILRLAARRLTPGQHVTVYEEEWLPELTYILKGAEARPITRLITGTRYALGILIGAPRIARHLHRKPEDKPIQAASGILVEDRGDGKLILVSGPGGVGKTRLAEIFEMNARGTNNLGPTE